MGKLRDRKVKRPHVKKLWSSAAVSNQHPQKTQHSSLLKIRPHKRFLSSLALCLWKEESRDLGFLYLCFPHENILLTSKGGWLRTTLAEQIIPNHQAARLASAGHSDWVVFPYDFNKRLLKAYENKGSYLAEFPTHSLFLLFNCTTLNFLIS